jgi:hypothetical protein
VITNGVRAPKWNASFARLFNANFPHCMRSTSVMVAARPPAALCWFAKSIWILPGSSVLMRRPCALVKESRVILLHEIDLGYGGPASLRRPMPICQANLDTAW